MERPIRSLAFGLFLAAGALACCTAPLRADEAEDRESALLFNTASRFYRQKNWRDAANTFSEFLNKFPRHRDAAEARFAAGYCLNRVSDHASAVEILRLSVRDENNPWSADSNFYLGRSLESLAADSKSDAEERGRRLVQAAESYGKAAVLYEKLSREESAPAKEGASPEPENPGSAKTPKEKNTDFRVLALSAQGEALYQAEKHADSAQALQALLKDEGSLSGSPYFQRGVYVLGLSRQAIAKQAKGSYADARAALLLAAHPRYEKESLWEEAAYLLARLFHQDNDLEAAIEQYGLVVKKGGGRAPDAAYYRGLALYETQKPEALEQARGAFSRFQRDHSKHSLAPRALFYEALSAFDLKDYARCEPQFKLVSEGSPDLAGRALLRRGQALLLKDEPNAQAAAEALESAAALLEKEAAGATGPAADPSITQRLAETIYWKGEALLALKSRNLDAARAFGEVHTRFARESPELAEKGLYQMARTLYLAGQHAQAVAASELYRKAFVGENAMFYAESLLLTAESAFHAPQGGVSDSVRRTASQFYREASAALRDPAEARRARYMSGVAQYFIGEYTAAGEALGLVRKEIEADPAAAEALPELAFYLADSLAQEPRREPVSREDRERWTRAEGYYREYLERSKAGSHIPNALVNLGLCQEWLEDHPGAKKTFERFVAEFPNHSLANQVRFELGNTRLVMGDLEGAAVAYASAADAGVDGSAVLSGRALYQKAMLERQIGKPSEAAATLSGLLAKYGEALQADEQGMKIARDARYQRSVALLESGKGDEARVELAAFLETNAGSPQEAEARNQLARSLLDAGKPADALRALEPVLVANAGAVGRDHALYLSAWCHSALAGGKAPAEVGKAAGDSGKERDEMEAAYRKLIAEHPQSSLATDAMLELGQHLFNRKAFAESKKWLGQVKETLETETVPAQPEALTRSKDLIERALFGLGFIAHEEGDFAGAAALFDRVAGNASNPLTPRATFQSGRSLMNAGKPAEAAVRFRRVADDFKTAAGDLHEESLLRLGECLHQAQKYKEALGVLDRLLKEYSEGPLRHEARFSRGFALQFSGDFDGAVEAYRAVVSGTRQPVAARAQYHIGECRIEQGRHRDAAKEFNTTVANFDFEGDYREWVRRSLLAAGMAFQTVGDPAAAETQFRELVERFPETGEGKAANERLKTLNTK